LTSLNLANNSLGDIVLLEGWTKQVNSERTAYEYKHIDGTVQGNTPGKPEGVIAIANVIPDMGALTSLNLSANSLGSGPATWNKDQGKYYVASTSSFITKEEAFSGAAALAGAIREKGALSVANVMGNNIGKEMLSVLQDIMRSTPNLVSLCGIADDATEADLSGLNMDADDAIILASELPDKGAMTSLNLSGNRIGPEGAKHIAKGIKVSKCVVAVVLAPFSSPSDHWLNCCCLLLSTG
jgi:hypothetical protein